VQVLIYVGAVITLILFTIMLTRRERKKMLSKVSNLIIVLLLFAVLFTSLDGASGLGERKRRSL
jgi:NADH:ubiquinone oxidoreductase subunit 6 (subunit J)